MRGFLATMLAYRVASLMAATCVAAVVILAADGRPGTEEPLPATALAQEETARRLETAAASAASSGAAAGQQPNESTLASPSRCNAAPGL